MSKGALEIAVDALTSIRYLDEAGGHELRETHAFEAVAIAEKALREVLAAPALSPGEQSGKEAVPVVWMVKKPGFFSNYLDAPYPGAVPLYAHPPVSPPPLLDAEREARLAPYKPFLDWIMTASEEELIWLRRSLPEETLRLGREVFGSRATTKTESGK